MAFQIKGLDLNPDAGDSWMGLTRDNARNLAMVFVISGLLLADPPFSIFPTDVINLWLAGVISSFLGIEYNLALVLTYTVIAWGLIILGAWIYPYNTRNLLNGYMNKIKRGIIKVFRTPWMLVASLVIFYFIMQWYRGFLV